MEKLEVFAERVDTLGRRVSSHSERLDELDKVQAQQGQKLKGVCKYQDKQNGSLQRLEARFNAFFVTLLGVLLTVVANIFLNLTR